MVAVRSAITARPAWNSWLSWVRTWAALVMSISVGRTTSTSRDVISLLLSVIRTSKHHPLSVARRWLPLPGTPSGSSRFALGQVYASVLDEGKAQPVRRSARRRHLPVGPGAPTFRAYRIGAHHIE